MGLISQWSCADAGNLYHHFAILSLPSETKHYKTEDMIVQKDESDIYDTQVVVPISLLLGSNYVIFI